KEAIAKLCSYKDLVLLCGLYQMHKQLVLDFPHKESELQYMARMEITLKYECAKKDLELLHSKDAPYIPKTSEFGRLKEKYESAKKYNKWYTTSWLPLVLIFFF